MSKTKIVSWEEWGRWVNKQLDGHQRKIEAINDSLTGGPGYGRSNQVRGSYYVRRKGELSLE